MANLKALEEAASRNFIEQPGWMIDTQCEYLTPNGNPDVPEHLWFHWKRMISARHAPSQRWYYVESVGECTDADIVTMLRMLANRIEQGD